MKQIKKVVITILDIIELYIPMALFVGTFICYLFMIAYRYFLNKQVSEVFELSQVLYMTCAMLSACYASRTREQVVFPLLYDAVGPKAQKVIRMIADVIVMAISGVLIMPTIESLKFISMKKTELLDIPFHWIDSTFLIFITLTMIYHFTFFVKEVVEIFKTSEDKKEIPEEV